MRIVLHQRKTQQRRLFLSSAKLFQTTSANHKRERKFYLFISSRPKEYHHIGEDDMTKDEFKKLCKTAWAQPHGFVVIDQTSKKNDGKYRCDLGTFYIPASI